MSRIRISTTVDGSVWAAVRKLAGGPGSKIVDAALRELLAKLETEQERAALKAAPYDDDPDLAWDTPVGPGLPYEAGVPDDVMELAEARHKDGSGGAGS